LELDRSAAAVPLDWTTTQNNLSGALWRLGARESGTASRGGSCGLQRMSDCHRVRPPL